MTEQQPENALNYLTACLDASGECLEADLALAYRTFDFAVPPR